MRTRVEPRAEYLERLRDQLPYRDGQRILDEVDGLIQDRMDAEIAEGRLAGFVSDFEKERQRGDAPPPGA